MAAGTNAAGLRVPGYDLARGLAVLAMVVLNVTGVLGSARPYPAWLDLGLDFFDRRAAAALMMISGAGISLYARAAWSRERQLDLVRRGGFLVAAGLLLSLIWSGDILHVYGVLICMGALLAQVSSRKLAGAGLVCFLLGGLRWTVVMDLAEEGGSLVWEGVADLLISGYFPLFPWAALFLAGMILGRLSLNDRQQVLRLWTAGLAAVCLGEGLAFTVSADWARTDLSLPTLTGMVSGFGTGLGLILASVWAEERLGRAGGRAAVLAMRVAAVGRTSLSFYILHILFLVLLAPLAGRDGISNLTALSGAAVLFYAAYAEAALVWLARMGRGPFEQAMRRFPSVLRAAGRPGLSVRLRS